MIHNHSCNARYILVNHIGIITKRNNFETVIK